MRAGRHTWQGCKSLGRAGPGRSGRDGPDCPARPGPTKFLAVTARPGPTEILGRNGPARPGPAEVLSRAGPVMLNFISIRIFRGFYKENLNFIINSFQIKYCSFKKMTNIREIFAESWQKTARPGPARRNFGPERPGPARPS